MKLLILLGHIIDLMFLKLLNGKILQNAIKLLVYIKFKLILTIQKIHILMSNSSKKVMFGLMDIVWVVIGILDLNIVFIVQEFG